MKAYGAVSWDVRGAAEHGILGDMWVGRHDAERRFEPGRAPTSFQLNQKSE